MTPPLKNPVTVYAAKGNLDAHAAVTWLNANDIPAYVVEDNSGASLFGIGPSQYHKPQVFVDKSHETRARELVREFESKQREESDSKGGEIEAECEECGAVSSFPASADGSVQDCPQCHAFIDVGELDWGDVDFGEAEDEPDDE